MIKDLTVGKESKLILLFALPMLLGNVFQQLYNIIDSIIVGQYIGKEALAAVGASFPVFFVLISLIIGVSSGSTIIISQYFGAKQFDKVKRAIDTMFIIIFVSSLGVTIIGISFSHFIFDLMKLPEEVMADAIIYFNILMGGVIMLFGYNGTSAILRGLGDSKTPLYFLIISTILNIILVILFVVVFKWGIAGAAIATVISQGVSFLLAIIYLNRYHTIINFSFKNMIFDKEIFSKSLKIGIPSGMQQTFVAIGMMALLRVVSEFGTNTIAAYTVAGRIDSFAAMPAMNFSMALSTFVGQNIGAKKIERVRKGYIATLWMTSIISVFVTMMVYFFGGFLMSLFTNDPDVISIGKSYLIIVSSFYILFSFMFVNNGVMRGAGDTLIPMFITLISLWLLRIPFSYILSAKIGSDGIWWSIPLAWLVGCALSYIYYKIGKWKRKTIVSHPVAEEIPLIEKLTE